MAHATPPADLPPGFRLFAFDCIDSTNAEMLRRFGRGDAAHFDVIVASSQTAGRGRRGRAWMSPEGNLYLTLAVALSDGAPVGQLAFVTALAVGDAIAELLPRPLQLRYKWPNDVLLDGRKLAGILIEGAGDGRAVAIGIGVNVSAAPSGTSLPAAGLWHAGAKIPATALIAPVCARFADVHERWRREGFGPLRAAWLKAAYGLGESMTAHLPDGAERRGVFRDIDRDGALLLEAADGRISVLAAGDVFFAAA